VKLPHIILDDALLGLINILSPTLLRESRERERELKERERERERERELFSSDDARGGIPKSEQRT